MLNVNDIEEIKTDLCVIRNKLAELRSLGLDDFGECDGSEDFCESIFDAEENTQNALSAIETILEEME